MHARTAAETTALAASTAAPAAAATATNIGQYLSFTLEEGVFAVAISQVREIIQYSQMTPVPLMPAFVRGVINLRGAVVPVIDLQARLGRAPAGVGERTSIVVFEAHCDDERHELGLMVDAVSEVISIADSAIDAPPQFGGVVPRDYLRGMAKVGGRFLAVLALDTTLDIQDMASRCEQAQQRLAA
jgi:purine-binding chemotaxis protein CheW